MSNQPQTELDEMIRKFKEYIYETNDYDELDFKSDLVDWHTRKLGEAVQEAYKKGYIDGGIAEINKGGV